MNEIVLKGEMKWIDVVDSIKKKLKKENQNIELKLKTRKLTSIEEEEYEESLEYIFGDTKSIKLVCCNDTKYKFSLHFKYKENNEIKYDNAISYKEIYGEEYEWNHVCQNIKDKLEEHKEDIIEYAEYKMNLNKDYINILFKREERNKRIPNEYKEKSIIELIDDLNKSNSNLDLLFVNKYGIESIYNEFYNKNINIIIKGETKSYKLDDIINKHYQSKEYIINHREIELDEIFIKELNEDNKKILSFKGRYLFHDRDLIDVLYESDANHIYLKREQYNKDIFNNNRKIRILMITSIPATHSIDELSKPQKILNELFENNDNIEFISMIFKDFNSIIKYLSNEEQCGVLDMFILITHTENGKAWWHLNKEEGITISILPILELLNKRGVKIALLMNCESLYQIERMNERELFKYTICTSKIVDVREIGLYLNHLFINFINCKYTLFRSHKLSIEQSSYGMEDSMNRSIPITILNNKQYTFNKQNTLRNIIIKYKHDDKYDKSDIDIKIMKMMYELILNILEGRINIEYDINIDNISYETNKKKFSINNQYKCKLDKYNSIEYMKYNTLDIEKSISWRLGVVMFELMKLNYDMKEKEEKDLKSLIFKIEQNILEHGCGIDLSMIKDIEEWILNIIKSMTLEYSRDRYNINEIKNIILSKLNELDNPIEFNKDIEDNIKLSNNKELEEYLSKYKDIYDRAIESNYSELNEYLLSNLNELIDRFDWKYVFNLGILDENKDRWRGLKRIINNKLNSNIEMNRIPHSNININLLKCIYIKESNFKSILNKCEFNNAFKSLIHLSLYDCYEYPDYLNKFNKLEILNLNVHKDVKEFIIKKEIESLLNLKALHITPSPVLLSKCNIKLEFEIKKLNSLKYFGIECNILNGNLNFNNNLKYLKIRAKDIKGDININNNLKSLILRDKLEDILLRNKIDLSKLNNIEYLNYGGYEYGYFNLNLLNNEIKLKKLSLLDSQSIKSIPSSLNIIQNINHLELSWCKLNEIPKDIYKLNKLKYLDLSINRINKIDSSISLLSNLEYINLRSNKLKNINENIYKLKSLTYLNISENQIEMISPKIKNLFKLKQFHCQYTNIKEIPIELSYLNALKKIDFRENKLLKSPSYEIFNNDIKSLNNYLKELEKGYQVDNKLKVTLIGRQGGGKTSLQMRMRGLDEITKSYETTIGIDVLKYRSNQLNDTELIIYDFGGQEEYYYSHETFLSDESLYLLIYDLRWNLSNKHTHKDDNCFHCSIGYWMECISSMSDEFNNMILIGTHSDQLSNEELKLKNKKINELINNKIKKRVESGFELKLNIINNMNLNLKSSNIDELINIINDMIVDNKFNHLGRKIPQSYYKVYKDIIEHQNYKYYDLSKEIEKIEKEIKSNEEYIELYYDLFGLKKSRNEYLNNKLKEMNQELPIISKSKFKEKCKSILNENNQNDNNNEELNTFINNNLKILKRSGEIIEFENINSIFTDSKWLMNVIKQIIRHSLVRDVRYDESLINKDYFNGGENEFRNKIKELLKYGKIEGYMIEYIFKSINELNELNELKELILEMIKILIKFDLIINSDMKSIEEISNWRESQFIIPIYMNESIEYDINNNNINISKEEEMIGFNIRFEYFIPKQLLLKLIIKLYNNSNKTSSDLYQDGCMLHMNGNIIIINQIISDHSTGRGEINIYIKSINEIDNKLNTLNEILIEFNKIISRWRGLHYEEYIMCNECIDNKIKNKNKHKICNDIKLKDIIKEIKNETSNSYYCKINNKSMKYDKLISEYHINKHKLNIKEELDPYKIIEEKDKEIERLKYKLYNNSNIDVSNMEIDELDIKHNLNKRKESNEDNNNNNKKLKLNSNNNNNNKRKYENDNTDDNNNKQIKINSNDIKYKDIHSFLSRYGKEKYYDLLIENEIHTYNDLMNLEYEEMNEIGVNRVESKLLIKKINENKLELFLKSIGKERYFEKMKDNNINNINELNNKNIDELISIGIPKRISKTIINQLKSINI